MTGTRAMWHTPCSVVPSCTSNQKPGYAFGDEQLRPRTGAPGQT